MECPQSSMPAPCAPMASGGGKHLSCLGMGQCHFANFHKGLQNNSGIKPAMRNGQESNTERFCRHLGSHRVLQHSPILHGQLNYHGPQSQGEISFLLANTVFWSPVTIFARFCSVKTWYQLYIWRQPTGKKLLAFPDTFLLIRLQQVVGDYRKRVCLCVKSAGIHLQSPLFISDVSCCCWAHPVHTDISSWQTKTGRICREILLFKNNLKQTAYIRFSFPCLWFWAPSPSLPHSYWNLVVSDFGKLCWKIMETH